MDKELAVVKEKHPIVSFKDVVGDIPESNAMQIKRSYFPMVKMLKSFEEQYEEISNMEVTAESCKLAGALRKKIKKVRTGAENNRVEQKAKYLRAGKAVDSVYQTLADAVILREKKLQEMEKYYENLEEQIIKDNRDERLKKLKTLDPNFPEPVGLGERDDEEFEMIFDGHEKKYIESAIEVVRLHIEAAETKRLLDLKNSRILECSEFAPYIPEFKKVDWETISDIAYDLMFSDAVNAKTVKDEEAEEKEAEEKAAEKILTDKADLFVKDLLKDGYNKGRTGYIKLGNDISYESLKALNKRQFSDLVKKNNILIQTETNNFILKCWNEADEINAFFNMQVEADKDNVIETQKRVELENKAAEEKAAALAPDKDKVIKFTNDVLSYIAEYQIIIESKDIETFLIKGITILTDTLTNIKDEVDN